MRNSNMHLQFMLYKINHNSLPIHSISLKSTPEDSLLYGDEAHVIITQQKWPLGLFFRESGENRHHSLAVYNR